MESNKNPNCVQPVSTVPTDKHEQDMLRHYAWMMQHTVYGVRPKPPSNEKIISFNERIREYCKSRGWDYDKIMRRKK